MISLSNYYQIQDGLVSITEQQGSDFAKREAGDFNPIHTVGSARFCVPGDLLFSVLLDHYGVYANTHVEFAQMVGGKSTLRFPDSLDDGTLRLHDDKDRHCLTLATSGERASDVPAGHELIAAYVQFSGKTFPDILQPLMEKSGVMINPARPLVIYKDMKFSLHSTLTSPVALELTDCELVVNGRKGVARLQFSITADGKAIGQGEKNMVLSGLRDYDARDMDDVVARYNEARTASNHF